MRLQHLFFVAFLLLVGVTQAAGAKYIFLFIGDGMAQQQRLMAEEYQLKFKKKGLVINSMPYQSLTTTFSANAHVTDSAAAGTAIACGEKTKNGYLCIDPSGTRKLTSVATIAQGCGRKVGIVTSVTINHATPAAFYANQISRNNYYEIGLDLIASDFDYFAGGGMAQHNNTKSPAYQGNLYELAAKNGYTVTSSKADFEALKPGVGKVLARGSGGNLPYVINQADNITLAEFTRKGIELLDNPNGFFMMVEGGAIDHCGHNNDAGAMLHETLAFDDAVQEAFVFAEKKPGQVLIIVTGDHETGGLAIGNKGVTFHEGLELLQYQDRSTDNNGNPACGTFMERVNEESKAKADFNIKDLLPLLVECYGMHPDLPENNPLKLTAEEMKSIEEALARHLDPKNKAKRTLQLAVQSVRDRKAGITWSSTGHTDALVPTTAFGPGAEKFKGFNDNTDIAKIIHAILIE